MARETVAVPIGDVTRRMVINVKVTGLRAFTLRMHIVIWIIRFAAWIAPVRMIVDTEVKS